MKRDWQPALLVLVAALVYLQTLPYAPVYDDVQFIEQNDIAHDPWNVSGIFSTPYVGSTRPDINYRPLTVWTFALNYRLNQAMGLAPMHPVAFHLVNLLLHALVTFLFFQFLCRIRVPDNAAFFGALLFAVLPIHTEAVTGIVGRAELFAAALGLVFLLLHLQRKNVALTALTLLLAIFGKESALTFPLVALGLDWLGLSGRAKKNVARNRHFLYAGAIVLWFAFRQNAIQGQPYLLTYIDNSTTALSHGARILTAMKYQLIYLQRMVLPIGLSSDNSYNHIPMVFSFFHPVPLAFISLVIGLGWMAWRQRDRQPAYLLFFGLYGSLFLLTSNFLRPIGTTVGERVAYAPSMAVCGALALVAFDATLLRRFAQPALILLSVAYGAATIHRNFSWKDEFTFFQQQVQDAPESAKAHYNFGTVLAKVGRDAEAIAHYEEAIRIYGPYPEPYYNMGNALKRLGADPERVVHAYKKTIQYDPFNQAARGNLIVFLRAHGRDKEAASESETLAKINPMHPALRRPASPNPNK